MLIQSGRLRFLNGLPWAAIEVTSEARIEEIVLHLVNWAERQLTNQPFQMLFPVKSRTVEAVTMLNPFLWARTVDLKKLSGMKSVMGVQGLSVDANGQIIPIEDAFVQRLIEQSLAAKTQWSDGVKEGSFVRILLGHYRMLCGTVQEMRGDVAIVAIPLKSRKRLIDISVLALQNLGERARDYFYTED